MVVNPPATSTLPLGSSVAVWNWRPTAMLLLVSVKVPLAGSYSSAVCWGPPVGLTPPPVTRTLPLERTVAVGLLRAAFIGPVALNVPVPGSLGTALLDDGQLMHHDRAT